MGEESSFRKSMEYKSRGGTVLHYSIVENSAKPVIVMVHNMFGNHKTFRRHVEFLNSSGYTCVTFNLVQASAIDSEHGYSRFELFDFMYRNWVRQIVDVLDSIPGRKVIFSLSGPSLAALIAASQRTDIDKFICDGGPFREFWACTYRMFTLEKKIANPIVRFIRTTISCLLWGPFAFGHLTRTLEKWNPNVPILSLRGTLDPIVFPQNIENVFKNHSQINIRVHQIEKGHHLDGLKNFPDEYSKVVLSFLEGETNTHCT